MADVQRVIVLGVFAGATAFSVWTWLSNTRKLMSTEQASAAKPKLTREALLAVIKECTKRADVLIETTEAALAAASPADRPRMTEGVAPALRVDLEEMQEEVFASQGTTLSEVNVAFEYFTVGAGRNRAVADAGSALRRKLGKHLATKARLLGEFQSALIWQVEHAPEGLEEAAAAAEDGAGIQEALGQWVQRTLDARLQQGLGLGMQEFMLRAQTLAAGDPAFAAKFGELADKGQEAVQQAIMRAAGAAGM